jgi:7-cyano-7-deazaguanine synthase
MNSNAVVLLSGGQDSAICLMWAVRHFDKVEAISFYYGQKHTVETICAERIAERLNVGWKLIDVEFLSDLVPSSLLKALEPGQHPLDPTLPSSFVPGRNILFLTIAAQYAYTLGFDNIVGGMTQADFSGYPDCRRNFISDMEVALSSGLGKPIYIHTPVMNLTKAEEVEWALSFPEGLEILGMTHTCYEGKKPPCGKCPACILREKGFQEAGIRDPLTCQGGKKNE